MRFAKCPRRTNGNVGKCNKFTVRLGNPVDDLPANFNQFIVFEL